MDDIYNTSFDVGVAVKEEKTAAAAAAVPPKSSKKKKRRKRKRSGSTSSFDGLPLPPPSTVDDDDVRAAGYPTETVTPNNRTDGKAESAVTTSETTGKKKKKKRRRKQKNDSGISNADDISMNESKAPSAIAEQGEQQPKSPERCKTSDGDISMPSTGKKKRKKKKKRKNSVTEDGASTASQTDVGDIIQQTKSTTVPKQGPLKGMFIKERSNLPVFQHRDEICNLVSKNDVLLVVAETVCYHECVCWFAYVPTIAIAIHFLTIIYT